MDSTLRTTISSIVDVFRQPLLRVEARWPGVARLKQPIRFGLVGVSGIVINTIILSALVWGAALPIWVASGVATELAILWNFLLNDRWTFRLAERRHPWWHRLLRFNSVSAGGLVITASVLTGLTVYFHIPLLLANLFAIGCATVWNYTMNNWWTWRRSTDREQSITEEVTQ
jgi:dolichol-phosphate mannosyltransferase